MRSQFGSGRAQLPFASSSVTTAAGAATSQALTRYFAISGANPAGLTQLSPIVGPVALAAGQRVSIALAAALKLAGESWESIVISASTTSDPASFVQIARAAVGATVTLETDAQLALPVAVASAAALPSNPVGGMLRSIASQVFEFVPGSARPVSSDVLGAVGGQWITRPGNFNTQITDTTAGGGCDRALDLVGSTPLRTPIYGVDGSDGAPRTFWLLNDDTTPIAAGTRVGISILLNGIPQTEAFAGLLQVRFLGYANPVTGNRRTIDADGDTFDWLDADRGIEPGKFDLRLPDALQPGEAFAFAVYPNFTAAALNGRVPAGVLSIAPFLYVEAGRYSELGEVFGDRLFPQNDRGFVVPRTGLSLLALSRSGSIASRTFFDQAASEVYGLQPNTANQTIAINGNGAMYVRAGTLQAGEGKRAIASTEPGETVLSPWSPATVSAGSLRATLAYPSDGTTAQIRANYPDAIAGLTGKAKLNAPNVRIYGKLSNDIRLLGTYALIDGSIQAIDLPSWAAAPAATLPTPADDFGLFTPTSTAAAVTGAGDYPIGVQIAYSFVYDDSTVTRISHSAIDGCVYTSRLSFDRIERSAEAWAEPTKTVVLLRQVTAGERSPYQSRYLAEKGNPYRFDPESRESDDGDRAIRPNDIIAADAGRWIRDDGSQILYGSAEPDDSIGEPGDYYFLREPHPQAGLLYFKQFGGWVSVINLKGDKGDPGLFLEGSWNSSDTFAATSVVTAGNSSWFALQANINIDPLFDDGTNWLPLARGLRFRSNWSAIANYAVHDVVRQEGKLYLSLNININVNPSTDAGSSWQIIFDGIRPAGTYNPIANYSYNDLVFLDGGSDDDGSYLYLNPITSSGNAPPNPNYWQRLARNGSQGATGEEF
jgi:hypothetical protein